MQAGARQHGLPERALRRACQQRGISHTKRGGRAGWAGALPPKMDAPPSTFEELAG
jgi:hypothetical protein